jgi:tRNA modification GTPase
LLQAEGLGQLLQAETEAQLSLSIDSYLGKNSQKVLEWVQILKKSLAHAEAYIDFESDEVK